jgi:hypothetical protein
MVVNHRTWKRNEALSSIIRDTNANSPPGHVNSLAVAALARFLLRLVSASVSKNGGLQQQKSKASSGVTTPHKMVSADATGRTSMRASKLLRLTLATAEVIDSGSISVALRCKTRRHYKHSNNVK